MILTIISPNETEGQRVRAEVIQVNYPILDTDYKIYARDKVSEKWGEEQFNYFYKLVDRESGWCYTIWNSMDYCPTEVFYTNPTDGSNGYGLGQTMVSLHKVPIEFYSDPEMQIDWIINYIEKNPNYGTPQKAYEFQMNNNYY